MNQRLRRSPPDVVYTPIDVTSIQRSRMSKRWHSDLDFDFEKQSVDVRELKSIGLTQASVGAVLGLSQSRVSRILSQSL